MPPAKRLSRTSVDSSSSPPPAKRRVTTIVETPPSPSAGIGSVDPAGNGTVNKELFSGADHEESEDDEDSHSLPPVNQEKLNSKKHPQRLILGGKLAYIQGPLITAEEQLEFDQGRCSDDITGSSSSSSSSSSFQSSSSSQSSSNSLSSGSTQRTPSSGSSLSESSNSNPRTERSNTRTPARSRGGTPGTNTPINGGTDLVNPYLQDYSSIFHFPGRKQNGPITVIATIVKRALCMIHLAIGAYLTRILPNMPGYRSKLEFPRGFITTEDGVTYNIDAVLGIIVAFQLHICARECLDAVDVYNRVMNYLTTSGFFGSYDASWSNVTFMSLALSKAIDNDPNLRVKIPRIAENFKQKLRLKTYPIVQSLIEFQPDFNMPPHGTGIILREVIFVFVLYFLTYPYLYLSIGCWA